MERITGSPNLSSGVFFKNDALEENNFPEENIILELTNFVVSFILDFTSSGSVEALSSNISQSKNLNLNSLILSI